MDSENFDFFFHFVEGAKTFLGTKVEEATQDGENSYAQKVEKVVLHKRWRKKLCTKGGRSNRTDVRFL